MEQKPQNGVVDPMALVLSVTPVACIMRSWPESKESTKTPDLVAIWNRKVVSIPPLHLNDNQCFSNVYLRHLRETSCLVWKGVSFLFTQIVKAFDAFAFLISDLILAARTFLWLWSFSNFFFISWIQLHTPPFFWQTGFSDSPSNYFYLLSVSFIFSNGSWVVTASWADRTQGFKSSSFHSTFFFRSFRITCCLTGSRFWWHSTPVSLDSPVALSFLDMLQSFIVTLDAFSSWKNICSAFAIVVNGDHFICAVYFF